MGEQKRRAERMTHYDRVVEELTRKLIAEGRLIEAAWMGLYALWVPEDAPPEQVADLRKAFMAGAQHLWGSIMTMLDPGLEETPADISRMQKIQAELDAFGAELARDHYPTKGTA